MYVYNYKLSEKVYILIYKMLIHCVCVLNMKICENGTNLLAHLLYLNSHHFTSIHESMLRTISTFLLHAIIFLLQCENTMAWYCPFSGSSKKVSNCSLT